MKSIAALAQRRTRNQGKEVLARIIGYTVLGGFIAFVLAVVIGIIVPREERSYSGTAEVVKSYKQKSLGTIDVRLSDRAEYSYVIRANPEGVKP